MSAAGDRRSGRDRRRRAEYRDGHERRSGLERRRFWTATEVCRATGLTYRQLDHWERIGVLVPTRPARGSGTVRGYTTDEVAAARALRHLSFLWAHERSAGERRRALDRLVCFIRTHGPHGRYELAPGVILDLDVLTAGVLDSDRNTV